MIESPNYERLRELAELANADQPDHALYAQVQDSLTTLEQTITDIRRSPGFVGEVRDSITAFLNERVTLVRTFAFQAEHLQEQYAKAREAISQANTRFGELITHLNTPAETRAAQDLRMVDFNGEVYMSQVEHNKAAAEERNRQREEAALAIINETNGTLDGLLPNHLPSYDSEEQERSSPDTGPATDQTSNSGVGANTSRSASRSTTGSPNGLPHSPLLSGAVLRPLHGDDTSPIRGGVIGDPTQPPVEPPVRWVPGPGGSIRPDPTPVIENPEWPRDVLNHPINARLTPQGPVGGYLPPGINIDDPRWRADYHNPALNGPKPTPSVNIVGGVLTTGAATATGAGAATTSATNGPNTPLPGYPLGMGGATTPTNNPQIRGGIIRPTGTPNANQNTQTTRPTPGMWSTPHNTKNKEDKPRRSLVGYDVARLYQDSPPPIDPTKFGPGNTDDLKPIPRDIDNDRW